jgi:hypothetical protein
MKILTYFFFPFFVSAMMEEKAQKAQIAIGFPSVSEMSKEYAYELFAPQNLYIFNSLNSSQENDINDINDKKDMRNQFATSDNKSRNRFNELCQSFFCMFEKEGKKVVSKVIYPKSFLDRIERRNFTGTSDLLSLWLFLREGIGNSSEERSETMKGLIIATGDVDENSSSKRVLKVGGIVEKMTNIAAFLKVFNVPCDQVMVIAPFDQLLIARSALQSACRCLGLKYEDLMMQGCQDCCQIPLIVERFKEKIQNKENITLTDKNLRDVIIEEVKKENKEKTESLFWHNLFFGVASNLITYIEKASPQKESDQAFIWYSSTLLSLLEILNHPRMTNQRCSVHEKDVRQVTMKQSECCGDCIQKNFSDKSSFFQKWKKNVISLAQALAKKKEDKVFYVNHFLESFLDVVGENASISIDTYVGLTVDVLEELCIKAHFSENDPSYWLIKNSIISSFSKKDISYTIKYLDALIKKLEESDLKTHLASVFLPRLKEIEKVFSEKLLHASEKDTGSFSSLFKSILACDFSMVEELTKGIDFSSQPELFRALLDYIVKQNYEDELMNKKLWSLFDLNLLHSSAKEYFDGYFILSLLSRLCTILKENKFDLSSRAEKIIISFLESSNLSHYDKYILLECLHDLLKSTDENKKENIKKFWSSLFFTLGQSEAGGSFIAYLQKEKSDFFTQLSDTIITFFPLAKDGVSIFKGDIFAVFYENVISEGASKPDDLLPLLNHISSYWLKSFSSASETLQKNTLTGYATLKKRILTQKNPDAAILLGSYLCKDNKNKFSAPEKFVSLVTKNPFIANFLLYNCKQTFNGLLQANKKTDFNQSTLHNFLKDVVDKNDQTKKQRLDNHKDHPLMIEFINLTHNQ